jgi:hypothetical protein
MIAGRRIWRGKDRRPDKEDLSPPPRATEENPSKNSP